MLEKVVILNNNLFSNTSLYGVNSVPANYYDLGVDGAPYSRSEGSPSRGVNLIQIRVGELVSAVTHSPS